MIYKRSKSCRKSKINILNVEIFVIKLRQIICLDKKGITKGLIQNVVLDFVITLRLLQCSLKL